MKRKWKRTFLAVLGILSSLFIFAGCKLGTTLDDLKEEYSLKAQVTYYANGGEFENKRTVKNVYYAEGQPVANIGGTEIPNISLTYTGYEFDCWYHAETDGNGDIVYTDETNTLPKMSDTKADFSKTLSAGEHWTLVANWLANAKIRVKLVSEDIQDNEKITIAGVEYAQGDEIVSYDFYGEERKRPSPSDISNKLSVKDKAYTFVQFYTSETCDTAVDWPIARGEEDIVIYAKYIKGNWTIVDDASDIVNIFSLGVAENRKYYQINDIDCAKSTASVMTSDFAGEWHGNGYKVKNLKINKEKIATSTTVALFGNITATAKIIDVTFENIDVYFETAYNAVAPKMYLLFETRASGSQVDVAMSGEIEIVFSDDDGSTVVQGSSNIQSDGSGGWLGWQYGEGDITGFDISGMALTVRTEKILF